MPMRRTPRSTRYSVASRRRPAMPEVVAGLLEVRPRPHEDDVARPELVADPLELGLDVGARTPSTRDAPRTSRTTPGPKSHDSGTCSIVRAASGRRRARSGRARRRASRRGSRVSRSRPPSRRAPGQCSGPSPWKGRSAPSSAVMYSIEWRQRLEVRSRVREDVAEVDDRPATTAVLDDLDGRPRRLRAHRRVAPPSATMNWPVTNEASFPVRNSTSPTRSSGVPSRGIAWSRRSRLGARPPEDARFDVGLDAGCPREPGRDGVDRDPVRPEVVGERARQAEHAALARHVGDEPRRRRQDGRGRDVDDPPPAALDHAGSECLREEELRLEVDAERLTERRVVELEERRRPEQRRVVHEHVAATDLRRDPRDVGGRADVGHDAGCSGRRRRRSRPRSRPRRGRRPRRRRAPREASPSASARPMPRAAPLTTATRSVVGARHASGLPPSSGDDAAGGERQVADDREDGRRDLVGCREAPERRACELLVAPGRVERPDEARVDDPGETETTRIRGASARASERVTLSSAAFDAQ